MGDTTHYHAYSVFETVVEKDESSKEQEQKKSEPRVTKGCRCDDRQGCNHPWKMGDEGVGTTVKSGEKRSWGHKASVLGFLRQGIPMDARAVKEAATYDGETFCSHVEKLFDTYPEIRPLMKRVLYDGSCDRSKIKEKFEKNLGLELKASFNPRRKQEIPENLPRCIENRLVWIKRWLRFISY